ncbi:MAG TPA: hypothetical protein VMH37_09360 [Candidatus Binataceae bacterium]|nr:hypothetical protein [Candidatus Binataceae bacterium]
MASAMGFFDRFLASSPEKAAVADLAELAGRKEALIARLERHAGMCSYANLRAGLELLATNQAESFKTLRSILSDRDTWPRPPESEPHEGSNNWERLSSDLELLRTIAIGMQKAAGTWEGVDAGVAEKLLPIAVADGDAESELRALALKCDPQALD